MNDSGFLAFRSLPRIRGSLRPAHWATALVATGLLAYSVLTAGLSGDIRYCLAALRSGEGAGYTPAGIFIHRPYFYRMFIAGLDSLTVGSIETREMIIRLAGIALCVAAGVALRAALVRSLPHREATLTAAAVGLSLALAPLTDFLQPEWAAIVLAVFAVAAVLGFERRWVAVLVASLPLGLAVMMKYSTAATAAMALLVVFAVDRVRAVLLGALTALSAVVLLAFSLWSGSHELQWAKDMPQINQSSLSRTGIHPHFIFDQSLSFLAERVYLSPVLALLPGALLLVLARQENRRRRAELAALAVLFVLMCIAAVAVQGNWFGYHAAALPVATAALWGLAVAGWYTSFRKPPLFFLAVTAVYALLGPLVTSSPQPRLAISTPVPWAAAGVALVAALLDLRRVRARRADDTERVMRKGAALGVAVASLAGVMCLAAPVWPGSPKLVDSVGHAALTNADFQHGEKVTAATAARLDRELPKGAPVLYLAFGDVTYYIGHPAQCRYPIPTFLQRTKFLPETADLPSTVENARCVAHDPAPYAVLQRSWFQLARIDPVVRRNIQKYYDCPEATGSTHQPVVCRLRADRA